MAIALEPKSVLIAPDKFKGTLTAREVATALVEGLQQIWPKAHFRILPIADGGEGFAETLVGALGGRMDSVRTTDAIGRPCEASFGILPDAKTAVVDLASASGLVQIPVEARNPCETTTLGTGRILTQLIGRGFETVVVGLGGSATNDAGVGLAAAFGFRFSDSSGRAVRPVGGELGKIVRIERPVHVSPTRFIAATDVDSPLFGPLGAAHQFARQKGASDAQVEELDRGLQSFARVVTKWVGRDLSTQKGAGAAGGCGFGMIAFLGAERLSGFELLSRELNLQSILSNHDLVVTGEGCFDRTSMTGKAPARLAELAREKNISTWGVFGRVETKEAARLFDRVATLPACDPASIPQIPKGEHLERVRLAAESLAKRCST